MSRLVRMSEYDTSDADRKVAHFEGVTMLDTTTLCGYTWSVETAGEGRPTCDLCLHVLAEMRTIVRQTKGVKAP